jgi:hypothetical protein
LAGIVSHPTTPFGIDMDGNLDCDVMVRNGLTGDPIVPIAPTKCAATKINEMGINDVLNNETFDDPVSNAVRTEQYAEEHLWPIHLPGSQAGPWAYWDSTFWKTVPHPFIPGVSLHQSELQTNPDMSLDKANRYIDTLIALFAPRACVAMSLGNCLSTGTKDINPSDVGMSVVPNPALDHAIISLNEDILMQSLMVVNIEGRIVGDFVVNAKSYKLNTENFSPGIYLVSAITNKGVASMRLVIE